MTQYEEAESVKSFDMSEIMSEIKLAKEQ